MINLDHNATTPTLVSVQKAMLECPQGNSHSVHKLGRDAKLAEKKAETILLEHLGNPCGRIVWTSSGSEANRIALEGLCASRANSLITSNIEHKSIDSVCYKYGRSINCLTIGLVPIEYFGASQYSYPQPKVGSLMLVNNETGIIQDVKNICNYAPCLTLHTDAVQALGKMHINPDDLNVDLISLSAHKIGGPKGIGALWVRDEVDIDIPYLGTSNTPAIVGFGKAIEELGDIDNRKSLLEANSNIFFQELIQNTVSVSWFCRESELIPGTMSLQFDGVNGVELAMLLESEGIIVSTGAACNDKDYSKVLTASGLTEREARSTIRVSLSISHTEQELKEAAKTVARISKELSNGS